MGELATHTQANSVMSRIVSRGQPTTGFSVVKVTSHHERPMRILSLSPRLGLSRTPTFTDRLARLSYTSNTAWLKFTRNSLFVSSIVLPREHLRLAALWAGPCQGVQIGNKSTGTWYLRLTI
jgi:hypothetical protein